MAEVIRKSDLRIIRYLQDNPRASVPNISRATGISEATVRRRVDALFGSGVITSAIIPDIDRLGYRSLAYVVLKIDLTRINEIIEALRNFPEVTTVAEIMGQYDVMFFIAQPTNEDLRRFVTERVATIPGVRGSETWIVPRLAKLLSEWRVPIDGLDQQPNRLPGDEFPDGTSGRNETDDVDGNFDLHARADQSGDGVG